LSEHSSNHLFERSLTDIKRSGNGCAERDFDGDDDAAVLERIDDPTQASEGDGDLFFRTTLTSSSLQAAGGRMTSSNVSV
jgi:hypothetical protein